MAPTTDGPTPLTAEDRLEIQELISEYSFCEDSGESERWANLFTVDGRFINGSGDAVIGRENLLRFSTERWANNTKVHRWSHWVNNITITATAEGADSSSYAMVIENTDEGPRVQRVSAKRDELRREDGRWRFHVRKVVPLAE